MNIQFDSRNRYEVYAAKLAIDYLIEAHEAREKEKAEKEKTEGQKLLEGLQVAEPYTKISERPYMTRKPGGGPVHPRLDSFERRQYPGLYRLAVMLYEKMEPQKFYTLAEAKTILREWGHPEASASAVLSHLVNKGYAKRPMKAMYQRIEKDMEKAV